MRRTNDADDRDDPDPKNCSRDRFFSFFCPPGRKLCQVPAASPLDALAPLHSRQSQRRDPGARHRAAAVLVRSPVAAPPGAIPPAPLKRKHSPTRGGSLERISRAARRRGAAGKIPAFERERARFGSGFGFGFGFGFDARWNRPTRRETKADRETRHPKRRRRRSQTRGETRRVHLYFCNAGEKRRARSSSSRRARRRRVRTRASECDRADHIHPP